MKLRTILAVALGLALLAGTRAVRADGEKGGARRRPGPPPGLRAKLLEKFDKDGDGKLNKEEREALRAEMKERHAKALKEFDKDGDGKLDKEERKALWEARLLERFDENENGVLDGEEVEKANQARERMKRRAGRGPRGEGGPRGPRGEGAPRGPRGDDGPDA